MPPATDETESGGLVTDCSATAAINPEGLSGFADLFAGRRVLVTGHTGFKGSWLALWLARLGADVSGFALTPPTTPSNFELSRVREGLRHHLVGDLRDSSAVAAAIEQTQPEVIFHLAAQALVRASYRDPAATFASNIMGTVNLLDAVRLAQRPCAVVAVTSDKCYEAGGLPQGHGESDPMGGHDPYSASKGACEIVIASYRRAFFPQSSGIRLASARAGNVIGGGDWADDRLIPDLVRAFADGRSADIRYPDAVRPWQHVVQVCHGYLTLAGALLERPDTELQSGFNFGPKTDDTAPVVDVVRAFAHEWGPDGRWLEHERTKAMHETATLRLDISKVARVLGWKPAWNLTTSVGRTARWYRRWMETPSSSMLETCYADIDAYTNSNNEPAP